MTGMSEVKALSGVAVLVTTARRVHDFVGRVEGGQGEVL